MKSDGFGYDAVARSTPGGQEAELRIENETRGGIKHGETFTAGNLVGVAAKGFAIRFRVGCHVTPDQW
jgi:hypothetical protein